MGVLGLEMTLPIGGHIIPIVTDEFIQAENAPRDLIAEPIRSYHGKVVLAGVRRETKMVHHDVLDGIPDDVILGEEVGLGYGKI